MAFLPRGAAAAVLALPGCVVRALGDGAGADGESSSGGSTSVATTSPATTAGTSASDTTSTSGAESSTSSHDPSGPGFIEQPDVDGIPECDVWAQDCPVGEKCTPWANDGGNAWNALRCSPVANDPAQPGDPCTVEGSGVSGIDDCDFGSMCWNVDPETLMGECIAFCTGSEANPICADACEWCTLTSEGVLILCLPSCDPVAQDCDEGLGCYPVPDAFACMPDAGGGMGTAGAPCEFINVCDPGLFCASSDAVPDCAGSTGCCAPFCDTAAPDVCDALLPGTICVPWYEEGMGPEGCIGSEVGACMLP